MKYETVPIARNHWEAGASDAIGYDNRVLPGDKETLGEWFAYLFDQWQAGTLDRAPGFTDICTCEYSRGTSQGRCVECCQPIAST